MQKRPDPASEDPEPGEADALVSALLLCSAGLAGCLTDTAGIGAFGRGP